MEQGETLTVPITKPQELRELTRKVIAQEKHGFWGDWTPEQQALYKSGDWEAFSRSRGYSEEEISDFRQWLSMVKQAESLGRNPLEEIKDLTVPAAMRNLRLDRNGEIILSSHRPTLRMGIMEVESRVRKMDGVGVGDVLPLTHTFADGVYVRQLTIPEDTLIVTKIHKVCHPYFLLQGEVSVLTEDGLQRLKAPYSGITPAGTKRIIYAHTYSLWTTVHVTRETDLQKIEDCIIAPNYEALNLPIESKALLSGGSL